MSPRTPKQFEAIREEKMALIMNSALEHFAKEGYHTTTINHIAKHAGISKGLMYNYFSSKEELLSAIIRRSVNEVYDSFDVNRDGILSEDEFEFFIRQTANILKEKKTIWRLFFQLLMQGEVREQFLKMFVGTGSLISYSDNYKEELFVSKIMKAITEYFIRKSARHPEGYDPYLELNMFVLTLKGFALTYVYMDDPDENYFGKTIEKLIATYK